MAQTESHGSADPGPLDPADGAARPAPPRVVALGGGHGLAASLAALRILSKQITGIVTVADNGGSSGRLRDELGILPPGDLRMALAALCRDDSWGRTWADVLQQRFVSEGPLNGHSVGNLLIAAVWNRLGDHVAGLDLVGELLGAQGRVLPMAAVPLHITADVDDGNGGTRVVHGQAQAAVAAGVSRVALDPDDPPACPEAVGAIADADWVVIGPGSWFTSVIPNLLVPGIRRALAHTTARKLVVLNLSEQTGETQGLAPEDHLRVLAEHAPELRLDVVLADPRSVTDTAAVADAAARMGARLDLKEVALPDGSNRHDVSSLAGAFRHFMNRG